MDPPPSDVWPESPTPFQARMRSLLADRDPISVLRRTADTVDDLVQTHDVGVFQTRPYPDKWTANEVIGHLGDTEWVYAWRLRKILCEDRPAIVGFEQDQWAAKQAHNDRPPQVLSTTFRQLRHYNMVLWTQLTADDWHRTGEHETRGPESLGLWIRILAGHDLAHLDQLERTLSAAEQQTEPDN